MPALLQIRDASVEDIPIIRQLTFSVWPQTYAPILLQEQISYMLDMMYSEASLAEQMKDKARFIIAEENNTPVGFASFQETEPGIYKLHKLYVLPSQQGKGTGRLLIKHIIDTILKEEAVSLQLQVNRHNQAKNFYEKLGFKVIAQADFDIGNGYFMNDYIMEKEL